MPFEDLLRLRRIHARPATPEEIARLLALADRDLKMARRTMAEDWDWAFFIAYNAVLQAAPALMYSQGFRPATDQGHKNTFAFMREALGDEFASLVGYFDRMRTKRNQAIYDLAGLITESEARAIFEKAVEFVELIKARAGGTAKSPPPATPWPLLLVAGTHSPQFKGTAIWLRRSSSPAASSSSRTSTGSSIVSRPTSSHLHRGTTIAIYEADPRLPALRRHDAHHRLHHLAQGHRHDPRPSRRQGPRRPQPSWRLPQPAARGVRRDLAPPLAPLAPPSPPLGASPSLHPPNPP